jgi:hypothetical protein
MYSGLIALTLVDVSWRGINGEPKLPSRSYHIHSIAFKLVLDDVEDFA